MKGAGLCRRLATPWAVFPQRRRPCALLIYQAHGAPCSDSEYPLTVPAQDPRSPSTWPCWRSCGAPPFTPELPLGSSQEAEPGQGAASPLPWSRSERRCPFQQPQRSAPSGHRPKPQNPVGASCAPASQAERFLSVGFSFSFIVAEVAPVHWVKFRIGVQFRLQSRHAAVAASFPGLFSVCVYRNVSSVSESRQKPGCSLL